MRPYMLHALKEYKQVIDLDTVTDIVLSPDEDNNGYEIILTFVNGESSAISYEEDELSIAQDKFKDLVAIWTNTKLDYGSTEPVLKVINVGELDRRVAKLEQKLALYCSDVDTSNKSIIEQWIEENFNHPDTRKHIMGVQPDRDYIDVPVPKGRQ